MFDFQKRNDRILLKNLVNIRWVAIIGQFIAIFVVYYILNIQIPIFYCFLIIVVSIITNILSLLLKVSNYYLSDKEAFSFLLFDTSQLAVLLYLTGGIYNPFSLLLIAPVVISASYLKISYSIILSCYSIIIVFLISFFYIELNWLEKFYVPNLFTYGIALSLVISIIFIVAYVYILANSSRKISEALNQTQTALMNQRKMSEIGSMAAAAAHEFSTPLNTIYLILSDLKKDKKINKYTKSDLFLLESQVNRCKEILLNLSKDPQYLKDTFLKEIKISNLIQMNFDKFNKNNKKLIINFESIKNKEEPVINFSDEIMYAIGNIVQNAVEHATENIDVQIFWNKEIIDMTISDDGKGFLNEILDKIGNPYISSRNNQKNMGLGIFIAKNFIENADGSIKFSNKSNNNGALVKISLKRKIL